jgi:hypothetical protein
LAGRHQAPLSLRNCACGADWAGYRKAKAASSSTARQQRHVPRPSQPSLYPRGHHRFRRDRPHSVPPALPGYDIETSVQPPLDCAGAGAGSSSRQPHAPGTAAPSRGGVRRG